MGLKLCRVWWFYSSCVNGCLCVFVSTASHRWPIHSVLQLHCDPELDQMQKENGMDAHLAEAVLNCFAASELSWKNTGNCSNNGLLLCTVCPPLTTLWSLKCGKKKKKRKCNVLWTSCWEQPHSGRRTRRNTRRRLKCCMVTTMFMTNNRLFKNIRASFLDYTVHYLNSPDHA